jgi:protein SERAC1
MSVMTPLWGHGTRPHTAFWFFGTPHKGLFIEDILGIIGGDNPRRGLVEEQTSEIGKGPQLKSLLAVGLISLLQDEEKNRFRRTGDFITSVERDSALLQLPDSMQVKVKVDADHSNIAKFMDRKGEPYTTALWYLRQFELEASKEVPRRFCM